MLRVRQGQQLRASRYYYQASGTKITRALGYLILVFNLFTRMIMRMAVIIVNASNIYRQR